MHSFFGQRRITTVLSAIGLVSLGAIVGGATSRLTSAEFDTITARRVNIVDPDGTLRLAIHNGATTPDANIRGRVYPRSIGNAAGLLLFDPDGAEVGGIVTSKLGSTDQYAMIFDYTQQATDGVEIGRTETPDGASYRGGLFIADRRPYQPGPLTGGTRGVERIALANDTGTSRLVISGTDGKPRIRIGVNDQNQAEISILDEDGRIIRSLSSPTR